jgi:MATE family multidrug resistance protein
MGTARGVGTGEAIALARLALPIIMARIGLTLMLVVDNMMVGHYGTADLAAFSLGLNLVHTMQTIGLGLLLGGMVEISGAFGRGSLAECGRIWRRSVGYALVIGAIGLGLTMGAEWLYLSLDQAPDLAHSAARITAIFAWSLPPMLVYLATIMLLESVGRPYVGVWLLLAANVVNLVLNQILVFGLFDLPGLGALGAAWATLIARLILAGSAVGYVLRLMPGRLGLGRASRADHAWRPGARQRRIGYAEGLSMGMESGAFAVMVIFAGQLGALDLASYSIAINLNMLLFMLAVGVGGASAVRVAQAYGRQDAASMARTGWSGVGVYAGLMGVVSAIFLGIPETITALYTTDPALTAAARPLVALVGIVVLIDGSQRVVANILRGYGEAWAPTTAHLVSYLVVMIPLGYYLAVTLGHGALGLILAIVVASIIATVLLFSRFIWLAARPPFFHPKPEGTWASS